jgi:hypothetical protein
MRSRLLQQLTSDDLFFSAAGLSTPSALRRFLRRTREVSELREALRQGGVTDESLGSFVSTLLESFRRGERFPHELALAALAVVLETRPTDFADEFLHDLSRLQLAEMCLCVHVARECLKHRVSLADNKSKSFAVNSGNGPVEFSVSKMSTAGAASGGRQTRMDCVYGAA